MYYKEKADVVWIYTYEGEKEAVDKKRIMKILAGIITIAGIVVLAFLILDNKAEQRKVQQVAAEDEKKTQSLEYIEMEELENQDKEKQTNGRIVFLSVLDADYCVDLQAAIAANLTS